MSAPVFQLRQDKAPPARVQHQAMPAPAYFDALRAARQAGQEQGERIGWLAGARWSLLPGFCVGFIVGAVLVALSHHLGLPGGLW